jgi:hypothetical protein
MRLSTHRRPRSLAKYLLFVLTVGLTAATLAVVTSADNSKVYADGEGSPVACLTNPTQNPNAANVQSVSPAAAAAGVDVGAGFVVQGVCIRTGTAGHSGVLGNGTFDGAFNPVASGSADACYVVAGVGTQEVTVTRVGDGPDCQDISHVDVIRAPANGTTTTTTTTTTTPTTTTPTNGGPPPGEVTPPRAVPPQIVVGVAPFTG